MENLCINLSAGRSCFTQCRGCYNHFGKSPKLVETDLILDFLRTSREFGIEEVTLCGGDPLSRPDIMYLIEEVKSLGFFIKLDTVGTPILEDSKTIFYGAGIVKKVSAERLSQLVDLIGIPIDGSTNEIMQSFRKGREAVLDEQIRILKVLDGLSARVCINTVVHKENVSDVQNMDSIIASHPCVSKWQLFQYTPTGPLGYKNRSDYSISESEFFKAKSKVESHPICLIDKAIKVEFKSNAVRKNKYVFIDSEGVAWMPQSTSNEEWLDDFDVTKERVLLGNIKEREDFKRIIQKAIEIKNRQYEPAV